MRKLYVLLMALCVSYALHAQVNSYIFSQSSGTYTEITGGTVLGTTSNDEQVFNNSTTGASGPVTSTGFPIGFNFMYGGTSFDKFAVASNGYIVLGTGSFAIANSTTAAISTTTTAGFANLISAFNQDLQGQAGSEISYATIGTAPNRTLVVQWKNYRRWNGTTPMNYNFQIRLNETTNTIDIVYGTMTTVSSYTSQIGLRGTSNADYSNRTTTTNWAATTAGATNSATVTLSSTVFPASGLKFTWTPATCFLPNNIASSNITTSAATITWNAASGSPAGYAYEVRTSGAPGSGATGLVTSGNTTSTSLNLSSLSSGTTYSFYIRTDCGAGNFSGWSTALSFATLCNPYNLPYTLNFESVTPPAIPNCTSIQKIGNGNNWVTANVTTNGFSSNVLQYGYNTSNAANAWFYTGGLNLTAGVSYRLVFKYGNNSTTYTEKLVVKFGTSAVNTSMNDLIVDLPSVTGGTAAFSTTDFTVPATGVYYIGFNAYSAANQFNLYVDDINVA
ncbi:MAG: hypothetical protein EON98_09735, partial [Chitinophagaceae bacterium]